MYGNVCATCSITTGCEPRYSSANDELERRSSMTAVNVGDRNDSSSQMNLSWSRSFNTNIPSVSRFWQLSAEQRKETPFDSTGWLLTIRCYLQSTKKWKYLTSSAISLTCSSSVDWMACLLRKYWVFCVQKIFARNSWAEHFLENRKEIHLSHQRCLSLSRSLTCLVLVEDHQWSVFDSPRSIEWSLEWNPWTSSANRIIYLSFWHHRWVHR